MKLTTRIKLFIIKKLVGERTLLMNYETRERVPITDPDKIWMVNVTWVGKPDHIVDVNKKVS